MFWQLTIDANDPSRLMTFWAAALGWTAQPPTGAGTWQDHYRRRAEQEGGFDNRLFDPAGAPPAIWFQQVPEQKSGKNRLHLDLYPTGRDRTLPQDRRIALVETKVAELNSLGATRLREFRDDDPDDLQYYVVMADPEGNEFCIS